MKYVSLLALAVAFAPTFVMAATSTGTGTANAKIVTPVEVDETTPLNFGTMLGKANTVSVSSAGARSATDNTGLVNDTNAPTAGVLSVTGPHNQPITVSIPSGTTVTSGANSMTISNLSSPQSGSQTLDNTGALTINIGGDLAVGANQAEGDYTGTYTITINY